MTPDAPTWGEIEKFLEIDRWTRVAPGSRGGSSQRHIFFEKLLDSGELLQTHISHSRSGRPSPGRFALILRNQIKVSRTEFWQALRSGEPVVRPVPVEGEQIEHDAWVVAVLAGELHMTAQDVARLDPEQARRLVLDHWSQPTEPRSGSNPDGRGQSEPRLLLATRNEHKRREFARLLPGFEVDSLPDTVILPPEHGDTFEANALAKARAAAAATGRVSIADDSGIEAAALDGAPGVRSARYAGEHASDEQNLFKLLREAPPDSPLAYVCALAYVDPLTGVERLFEGRCGGRLADAPRGENGFGYDPAFLPDEESGELTMAQLSDERKDAISHRGRAVRALHAWLTSR
jgi:XTP/dITP diphosphohydrolase